MTYYDALTEFIFVEHMPQKADYIFIPGSGYGELAIRAAELYQQEFANKIVVSGRYSILGDYFPGPLSPVSYIGQSYETESDFLTAVLIEHGVPEQAILCEKQATFTYENAIYTRKLLEKERVESAILVCQAYHARRSLLYYQQQFPETIFYVCPAVTREITRGNWHLDAGKIDVVLGEVERCGNQFHEIMKEGIQK